MYVQSQHKSWRKPNVSLAIVGFNLLLLMHFIGVSEQFYLPGLAPVNYCIKSDASNNCKVSCYGKCEWEVGWKLIDF